MSRNKFIHWLAIGFIIPVLHTNATPTIEIKVGSSYQLKSYPNNSSVTAKIEAESFIEHIGKIYLLTFHGICMVSKSINSDKSQVIGAGLNPILISESALLRSIEPDSKSSKTAPCDYPAIVNFKEIIGNIAVSGYEILLSPLDAELSLFDDNKFKKVVVINE